MNFIYFYQIVIIRIDHKKTFYQSIITKLLNKNLSGFSCIPEIKKKNNVLKRIISFVFLKDIMSFEGKTIHL